VPRQYNLRLGEPSGGPTATSWAQQRSDDLTLSDGLIIVAVSRAFSVALVDEVDVIPSTSVVFNAGGGNVARTRSDDVAITDAVTVEFSAAIVAKRRLLGVYNSDNTISSPTPEDGILQAMGRYQDISSVYLQNVNRTSFVAGQVAKKQKMIVPLMAFTSKAIPGMIGEIANQTTTGLSWLQTWVDGFNTVHESMPYIPTYTAFNIEWEVGVNKGTFTGVDADPAVYGAALSVFFDIMATDAPHVTRLYWVGGSDGLNLINPVMSAVTVFPDEISCDPYVNGTGIQTATQNWHDYVDKFRVPGGKFYNNWVRFGKPPVSISEHGDETDTHTAAVVAAYFTTLREQQAAMDLPFTVFFNSDNDKPHMITSGASTPVPAAVTNFGVCLASTVGTAPSAITSTVTTVADPDTSTSPALVFELAGLVASYEGSRDSAPRRVFFGVNDQNYVGATNGSFFAFDDSSPFTVLGEYKLQGVTNSNFFKDLAWGPGPSQTVRYLYICRVGSGATTRQIYRVPEPDVLANQAQVTQTVATAQIEIFNFGSFPVTDCSACFVDPITKDFFFVEKKTTATRPATSNLYRVPAAQFVTGGGTLTASLVGAIRSHDQTVSNVGIVAGDISRDGRYIALCNQEEMWIWHRSNVAQTVTSLFQTTTVGPTHQLLAAGAWNSESLTFDVQTDLPTRIYGIGQTPTSQLSYVGVSYA
jgi:hypothetical protein